MSQVMSPVEIKLPKFTTTEEIEKYAPYVDSEYVKRDGNPTGCVFKPVNMLPRFFGAIPEESVMQFYVVKMEAKGVGKDRSLLAANSAKDTEASFLIDCVEFEKKFKKS